MRGADRPVDHRHRQMPEEIDDPRMRPLVARRDELVQQRLDLGPHALQGAHGGEQRAKGRAHAMASQWWAMPGNAVPIRKPRGPRQAAVAHRYDA